MDLSLLHIFVQRGEIEILIHLFVSDKTTTIYLNDFDRLKSLSWKLDLRSCFFPDLVSEYDSKYENINIRSAWSRDILDCLAISVAEDNFNLFMKFLRIMVNREYQKALMKGSSDIGGDIHQLIKYFSSSTDHRVLRTTSLKDALSKMQLNVTNFNSRFEYCAILSAINSNYIYPFGQEPFPEHFDLLLKVKRCNVVGFAKFVKSYRSSNRLPLSIIRSHLSNHLPLQIVINVIYRGNCGKKIEIDDLLEVEDILDKLNISLSKAARYLVNNLTQDTVDQYILHIIDKIDESKTLDAGYHIIANYNTFVKVMYNRELISTLVMLTYIELCLDYNNLCLALDTKFSPKMKCREVIEYAIKYKSLSILALIRQNYSRDLVDQTLELVIAENDFDEEELKLVELLSK